MHERCKECALLCALVCALVCALSCVPRIPRQRVGTGEGAVGCPKAPAQTPNPIMTQSRPPSPTPSLPRHEPRHDPVMFLLYKPPVMRRNMI